MPGWFKNAASRRDSSPGPGEAEDGSAKDAAGEFQRQLVDHLQARAELLGIELREAGNVAARKGSLGVAVVVLAFLAYALLLAAAVSLLGLWLKSAWPNAFGSIGWQFAAIALGVLHLLLALILFKKLNHKPAQPLFEYTRAEFQKDREWLQKKHSSKGNDASP